MPGTNGKKTKKKKKQPSAKVRSARPAQKRKSEVRARIPDLESRIRERAYHIFLNRGGVPGEPLNDWLEAERELTS